MGEAIKWRNWARIVAYLELIITVGAALLLVGCVIIVAATQLQQDNRSRNIFSEKELSSFKVSRLDWTLLSLYGIFIALGFWAAVQLKRATDFGRGPTDALKLSKNWLKVSFMFLIMDVAVALLDLIGNENIGVVTVPVLVRGLYLILVRNFREELKALVESDPTVVVATIKV